MRSWLGGVGGALGGLLALVLGVLVVALFIGLEIGGISFRKDCVTRQGTVTHDWTFQWYAPIPYVFRPSQPGCAVHTGTRVALNEVGLFPFTENPGRILLKSGGTATGVTAYYDGLFAVIGDLVAQVKAGGFIKAPPDFLRKQRAALEGLLPPESVATKHAHILKDMEKIEADFAVAKATNDRATPWPPTPPNASKTWGAPAKQSGRKSSPMARRSRGPFRNHLGSEND